MAALPRCRFALSGMGRSKRSIPVEKMARYLAELTGGMIVYRCGQHFHLATLQDTVVATVKPRDIETLLERTEQVARTREVRMFIYGTRTPAGRWRYRARPAAFRDRVAREGEL